MILKHELVYEAITKKIPISKLFESKNNSLLGNL
jgi:hypothetical protein